MFLLNAVKKLQKGGKYENTFILLVNLYLLPVIKYLLHSNINYSMYRPSPVIISVVQTTWHTGGKFMTLNLFYYWAYTLTPSF